MNLAKKSTILLTALGVFALASCNSGSKKLSYADAVTWVEKHYGTDSKKKTISKVNVNWDYSKNPNDKKTPGDGEGGKNHWIKAKEGRETEVSSFAHLFDQKDINYFVQQALINKFGLTAKDAEKKSSNVDIDYKDSIISEFANVTLSKSNFGVDKTAYNFLDDEAAYTTSGNQLKAEITDDSVSMTVEAYEYKFSFEILYDELEVYNFGGDGFLKNMIVKMSSTDCEIELEVFDKNYAIVAQGAKTSIGELNTTIICTPK